MLSRSAKSRKSTFKGELQQVLGYGAVWDTLTSKLNNNDIKQKQLSYLKLFLNFLCFWSVSRIENGRLNENKHINWMWNMYQTNLVCVLLWDFFNPDYFSDLYCHSVWGCFLNHCSINTPAGDIVYSSNYFTVIFIDNCYKLLKSLHLIGREQFCRWKSPT